jgi:photosystem II stability/assembly factor-like uncharacterized protein
MRVVSLRKCGLAVTLGVAVLLAAEMAVAQSRWTPLGPDGGDVRSLSYDPANPDHILLGTSSGELFSSTDRGATWSRLAHLGSDDDYVLDHIVFDTEHHVIYVAAWSIEDNGRGDLFRSRDGGRSWEAIEGMHNKSIRSFAMAQTNHDILAVGALDGVFRSDDRGKTWQRISPENHAEIKNIESLAIDPKNPEVVYAGTWHLPWKTEDGGKTWKHMKDGIIDDSDVFSIIVDHSNSSVVYLSACSGIYKSENAGAMFHKIQGIPSSARRTRMLHQDPVDPNVVYAGTTEGLWKTVDAGRAWKRVTPPNVIVNDISVDPRNAAHVLLATDRSGVLMSENAAVSFQPSNQGFAHRQVATVLGDRQDSNVLYAGVVNDKEYGGVFVSRDGGQHWTQRSSGLGTRDIFVLRQGKNGELVAGTNTGVFILAPRATVWVAADQVVNETKTSVKLKATAKTKARTVTQVKVTKSTITGRVADIDIDGNKWYAATSQGLFISDNSGRSWRGPVLAEPHQVAVHAEGELVIASTIKRVMVSHDGGANWQQAPVTFSVTVVRSVNIGDDGALWVASREGAFRSSDGGTTWQHMHNGLPHHNVLFIGRDAEGHRLLAAAATSEVYESTDGGRSWHGISTGFRTRSVFPVSGRLFAATDFEGLVAQPSDVAGTRNSAPSSGSANR